ncbi:SprB repeat-containing protein [Flavobacterium chryseum]|uniref:SprB repeat-containing protein n=1 Tax=Flavobacterium sp. P3160 TaxID=2512113 RepID=UPI00105D6322|nr:SprB repeat-containing protein [Flavobacterium sp. P3160]
MKKYIKTTFILLFLAIKTNSQTYNITLKYSANGAGCHAASYNWSFYGDGVLLDDFGSGGNNMNVPLKTVVYDTYANSSFSLSISSGCTPLGASTKDCNDEFNYSTTAVNLIKGTAGLSASGCNGSVYISKFIPNVNIKNLDTSTPTEVCAGFQLSLAAFPAGFPQEAYHWQYSVNNKVSWIDVPATMSGRQTNDIATPTFSMQELLGATHANYMDKQIFFRLGYSGTAFTTPLALTYSACSPIVTNIEYDPPKCNGDQIPKVSVSFNRPLNTTEYLSYISIVDKNNGALSNQRINTVFDIDNPQKYTFYNITPLEDTRTYQISYQAQEGSIARGSMLSTLDFTYNDPKKMQFKITGQTQPTCFGGTDGSIEVEILSGANPYNFYIDNVLQPISEITQIDASHYKITGLKANVLGYKIKVTDKNDCIEKVF